MYVASVAFTARKLAGTRRIIKSLQFVGFVNLDDVPGVCIRFLIRLEVVCILTILHRLQTLIVDYEKCDHGYFKLLLYCSWHVTYFFEQCTYLLHLSTEFFCVLKVDWTKIFTSWT